MTAPGTAYGREYARLPEDLLADLLADAPVIADQVQALLGPALAMRAELRQAALAAGLVQQTAHGPAATSCAVDGGFAVERTVAVDIALSVAVGVEGFAPPGQACAWESNQYVSDFHVLGHDLDNERLARAAMIAQELDVLDRAPHEFRVYDGSHLTPVIQLNSGFSSRSVDVSGRAAELCARRELPSTLRAFATDPEIVAMPKYDSSRSLCDRLSGLVRQPVPGDDKYVAGLVLRGGEHTIPEQVHGPVWRQLHLSTPSADPEVVGLVAQCDAQLAPLTRFEMYSLYFRPDDTSPAYRVEVKPDLAHDADGLASLFGTLHAQMTGPFVREPYPQYLADVMAKSVSYGLSALQTAAQLALTRDNPELAQLVVHSYRTEGK